MLKNIKYIDNNVKNGIDYDWDFIFKEYKKLKCPTFADIEEKDGQVTKTCLFNPCTLPMKSAAYFQLLSERSTGKTTNVLLIGMIMNEHYGTIIHYLRQHEDMLKPSLMDLFGVINGYENGRYIKQITNGKYSHICYKDRKFFYCNVDDNGKIIDKKNEPLMQLFGINQWEQIKSTYNCPTADYVIYDEFLTSSIRPNEFSEFLNTISSLFRDRQSGYIIMMANTINLYHPYFSEFCIAKEVKRLKKGEHLLITSDLGTTIYIELLDIYKTKARKKANKRYFGINNPKVDSITGEGREWDMVIAPHMHFEEDDKIVFTNKVKMTVQDDYYSMDLIKTTNRGLIVNVHHSNTKDATIMLTNGEIWNSNEKFGIGKGNKVCDLLFKLYTQNKWYYDTNDTATAIDFYIKDYLKKRR